jgi:hypothetical protein
MNTNYNQSGNDPQKNPLIIHGISGIKRAWQTKMDPKIRKKCLPPRVPMTAGDGAF